MYCSKCGTEIEANSNFCPSCGNEINKNRKETDETDQSPDEDFEDSIKRKSETSNESADGISRRKIGSILGLIGIASVSGSYYYLRTPDPIVNGSRHQGINSTSFILERESYVDFQEVGHRENKYLVYSKSREKIVHTDNIFMDNTWRINHSLDTIPDLPYGATNILPEGEYQVISFNQRPSIRIAPIHYFREKRSNTTEINEVIDYISRTFKSYTIWVPSRLKEKTRDYRIIGPNKEKRLTTIQFANGSPKSLVNSSRTYEELIQPVVTQSNETIQNQYEKVVKENTKWRIAIAALRGINQQINDPISDFMNKLSNGISSFEVIPDELVTLLLNSANNTVDAFVSFYALQPKIGQEKVEIPIGIVIEDFDSIPPTDESLQVHTHTATITMEHTQEGGIFDTGIKPSNIQSSLINSFNEKI